MTRDIDKAALHALLNALGPSPKQAGEAYENLRERLTRFFRWNGCQFAEELADTALDRLAEKLAYGSEQIQSPVRFVTGIARMLLLESRAREIREKKFLNLLLWLYRNRPQSEGGDEIYNDALSHCLDKLTAENRNLLERYYSGDAGERIHNRRTMADELGIAVNALRNRALRLRSQLERCTDHYLAREQQRDRSPEKITRR